MDLCIRVDILDPGCRRSGLGHANGCVGGQDLAVDIGYADGIVVNKIQCAHAAAGQRLYGIAAYSAQAKHGNSGAAQLFHGITAHQKLCSGKRIHANLSLQSFFIWYHAFAAVSKTSFCQ